MDKKTLVSSGFLPLTIQQKELYCNYLGNTRVLDLCYLALDGFWDCPLYREQAGVLLVCVNEPEGYLFLPPMGDFDEGLRQILQLTPHGQIGYLTKEQADRTGLPVQTDHRFDDYIVPISQLLTMTWKYKHKLSDYNYFINNYDFKAEPITVANAQDCTAILEDWCNTRDCTHCLFSCEKQVLARYLAGMPKNGLCGLIVYINDQAVGSILGTVQGDSLFYPYAKSQKITGLSVYMYVELARQFETAVEYVNLGSDGGMEGIRRFKNKFAPYTLIGKWFTSFNQPENSI